MHLMAHRWAGGCVGVGLIALTITACDSSVQPPAPPSSETAATQVATLASYHVNGRQFSLVSFDDQSGASCVAVDQPGHPGVPACDIELNAANEVNAAILDMGGGITAVYGRAASVVRQLLTFDTTGHVTSVRIYLDRRSGERYFVVFVRARQITQFAAITPSGRQSVNDLNHRLAAFLH
jgi:hypothetical protein